MSNLMEALYLRCPLPLQRLGISLYGRWWYHRRFNARFQILVDELKDHEGWTAEQFRTCQEVKLDKLLEYACKSPYYDDLFRRYGVDRRLNPFEALSRI